jgi:hypothetical protein
MEKRKKNERMGVFFLKKKIELYTEIGKSKLKKRV